MGRNFIYAPKCLGFHETDKFLIKRYAENFAPNVTHIRHEIWKSLKKKIRYFELVYET